jgi:hypothetical protein
MAPALDPSGPGAEGVVFGADGNRRHHWSGCTDELNQTSVIISTGNPYVAGAVDRDIARFGPTAGDVAGRRREIGEPELENSVTSVRRCD